MKFVDYDNDGWPDILQLNGAMLDNVHLYHGEVQYKEPLLMFRNLGKGQFEKVSDKLGPDFVRPIAGRGLATADFETDGRWRDAHRAGQRRNGIHVGERSARRIRAWQAQQNRFARNYLAQRA